ncbi:O-antigen ligase family protein [bacterium]|nr:O-antigen ligase family protein [bacterium]
MYSFLIGEIQNDLAGRLFQFSDRVPVVFWVLPIFYLAGTLFISSTKYSFFLVPSYLFLCLFSVSTSEAIGPAATLARWWLIVCFCIAAAIRSGPPGTVCRMLGFYWAFSLVTCLWSPSLAHGIQSSGLAFLLTYIGSRGLAGMLSNTGQIRKVFLLFAGMSPALIAISVAGLSSLTGGRYAGGMAESYGLFVITGGLLMPTLLWCFFSCRGRVRFFYGLSFLFLMPLLLLSAQRTGFFAGVIACIPMLMQFSFRRILYASMISGGVLIVGVIALNFFPEQKMFIQKRFFVESEGGGMMISTNTTNRTDRWTSAIEKIGDRPFIGYGASAHREAGFGGFHNAYLQEWYNGGILGVVLFFGASVVALWKSFRLLGSAVLSAKDRYLCRLLFSLMLFLILVSFFESKLASPSNIMVFVMVLVGVSILRLEQVSNRWV